MTGEDVKALRDKYGLSQRDMALVVGVAQPTIAAMEAGTRTVTQERYDKMNAALTKWWDTYNRTVGAAVIAAFNKDRLVRMRREVYTATSTDDEEE